MTENSQWVEKLCAYLMLAGLSRSQAIKLAREVERRKGRYRWLAQDHSKTSPVAGHWYLYNSKPRPPARLRWNTTGKRGDELFVRIKETDLIEGWNHMLFDLTCLDD